MRQPGFMVYAEDWAGVLEDYDAEEIGSLFVALLKYFRDGETTAFEDRGMRQFFRQASRFIELDRMKYDEKCATNAYNRYKRTCKENEMTPLSREQWFTTVYDRKPP